jgi:diaminopropionate ammonia-lyase
MTSPQAQLVRNSDSRTVLDGPSATREPLAFHRRLPGYTRTPLIDAPLVATALGVKRVLVKDESSRFGLPSFKILGASWAVHRALAERLGADLAPWRDLSDLRQDLMPMQPLALAAATDGNHGHAVARMARFLGLEASIFVPAGTTRARIEAIAGEGASVTLIEGNYDDAVRRSAEEQANDCIVVSDTSWPGYQDIPRAVIEGYSTILWEVDDELVERGEPMPDLVAVQIGVGALAAAVARHFRRHDAPQRTILLGVEPKTAACALASIEAGRIVSIRLRHESIMAGVNCGMPSTVGWPAVAGGIDFFVAVEDQWARDAMRVLAEEGLVAGESGAAGLAGLLELANTRRLGDLGAGSGTTVLILVTEGATDPGVYEQIVRRQAPAPVRE